MARLQDVLFSGTRAAQPLPAAAATGSLYCVEDEGFILEQNDGAAWNPYSPTSVISSITWVAADPGAPADGDLWFKYAATELTINIRVAGVTKSAPIATLP